eukprot:450866_1
MSSVANEKLQTLRGLVNSLFVDYDPFSIIVYTLFTLLTLYLFQKVANNVLTTAKAKAIHGGGALNLAELEQSRKQLSSALPTHSSKHDVYHTLPDQGVDRKLIREELLHQLSQELAVIHKRGHGGIYVKVNDKYERYLGGSDEKQPDMIDIVAKNFTMKEEAYLYFSHSNTLYPFIFPGIRKFDVELISMVSEMLHAKEPAGTITSGGSESIFLAMKTWRSYGEKVRGIGGLGSDVVPNVILSKTAHPAFPKACDYLRIEARYIDFYDDRNDGKYGTMNLEQLESTIDANTICIVGSAPGFPYSVTDDIEGICRIAKRHGDIPVHVDNCLGGFVLSFLPDHKPFDFRVDGVCSVSCDMHKQAGSDKGCSAIIYNTFEYRNYQYYAFVNWPGGLYTCAGFQGAGNGGVKAVAWAMLLSKGKDKLKKDAIELADKVNYFKEQITKEIEGCDVLGDPVGCGVAFKFSGKLENAEFAIAEAMSEVGGWQMIRLQFPIALFFQASHQWIDQIDQMIADLKKSIVLVAKDPQKYSQKGLAQVYGAAATFSDRSVIEKSLYGYLNAVHSPY